MLVFLAALGDPLPPPVVARERAPAPGPRITDLATTPRQEPTRAVCRLKNKRLLKLVRRGSPNAGPNVYRLRPYDPTAPK
jgi:hypothetical protein